MRQEGSVGPLGSLPLQEAKGLLKLLENGDTVDTVRELIGVPPRIAAIIHAYLRAHPEDGPAFAAVLSYRQRVAEEFEMLVRLNGHTA